jgi:predicted transcriptional regulator
MAVRTIFTDGFEGWKSRARARAKAMDHGERVAPSRSITVESVQTMTRLMTPGRMQVLNTVRHHPSTVSALAKRLKRDVSAVSRDVAAMERVGMLKSKVQKNPGHGQVKVVHADAGPIHLIARI